jgi:hypothetical protein
LRAEVCKGGHAGALLATEDEHGEGETVAICGLEELALLEAIGGAELLHQASADLVELGSDLGA